MSAERETLTVEASSGSETVHIEKGERVYPCRCGHTHRGNHGFTDWHHHNCFHPSPLIDLGTMCDEEAFPGRSWLICGACGLTFDVEVAV